MVGVSIYSDEYSSYQQKFKKTYGNKVHPFYGQTGGAKEGFESSVSVEKNFSSVSPAPASNREAVKVLLLGGSVASHFSRQPRGDVPEEMFSRMLNEAYNTDRFVVYNAAFGGGKQPQQYFKLLYLDLLGFEPDIIINYDGFNEIALPLAENLGKKLNAIYPRSFDEIVFSSNYDGGCFDLNNAIATTNSLVPLIEALKWLYIKYCHEQSVGIAGAPLSDEALFTEERDGYVDRMRLIWERSSNRIHEYAQARGIPYLHFIQPNQHLMGSKVLTPVEQKMASKLKGYRDATKEHYGSLNIENLDTVMKFDQRYLFVNEAKTVYSDGCCHFNALGMKTIIADIIKQGDPIFVSAVRTQTYDAN